MTARTLDVVGREDELAAIDAVLEAVVGPQGERGPAGPQIDRLNVPGYAFVHGEVVNLGALQGFDVTTSCPSEFAPISGGYEGVRLRIDRSLPTVNGWRMAGSAEVLGGYIQPFVLCVRFETRIFVG